ncbi:MAG: divisome protein SepX/GlpR [Marmoricola sp.]
MDLSGIIFAAVAVGWAVYLIPKAVQQHDEMARSRAVESFSHRMRVLGKRVGGASAKADRETDAGVDPETAVENTTAVTVEAVAEPVPESVATGYTISRASARGAARRRRRILALLVLAVVAVAALAWQSVLPRWSIAIPAGLVLGFLALARVTVRRQRSAGPRTAQVQATRSERGASKVERSAGPDALGTAADESDTEAPSDREDTVGVPADELAAVAEGPLPDDGALWDPLPVTLPTYVGKPRTRRTVRTIELTRGVTSSGHDAADTALAREAAAQEAAAQEAQEAEYAPSRQPGAEQRRAVGE